MKTFSIFLLLLVTSLSECFGCAGFYPYGEDVRFRLMNPAIFDNCTFNHFRYSARYFYETAVYVPCEKTMEESDQENIALWSKRYKGKIDPRSIYEALYEHPEDIGLQNTANAFINYLRQKKDRETLEYLEFVNKITELNTFLSDPWERNEDLQLPQRSQLISQALDKAKHQKDAELAQRYAFLAIRLAYYNENKEQVAKIYKDHFAGKERNNIIAYWALYFNCIVKESSPEKNLEAAIVFLNTPDKRDALIDVYARKVPLDKTLTLAKTKEEQIAVNLLAGTLNVGKALKEMRNLFVLDKNLEALKFLLLREINKLEDWIYTPYYSFFEPSTVFESFDQKRLLERVKEDRQYAGEVLQLVIDMENGKQPQSLEVPKAYLLVMTERYEEAIELLNAIEKRTNTTSGILDLAQQLKCIALIAMQQSAPATIPPYAKPILIKQEAQGNYRFVLALAKELEFKKNPAEAALLLSKLNRNENYEQYTYWRTEKRHATIYADFYDNYFYYMDASYTCDQLTQLTDSITQHKDKDNFDNWLYDQGRKDQSRLYDLLGTKFIRENNLDQALVSFNKVGDSLWSSSNQAYKTYLNANSFYTNFYNEHSIIAADSLHYNKREIVQKLISLLKKAEDKSNKDRDYSYFLAANCYFNMTQYGNSWMMRRYSWSSGTSETKLSDDKEFFECDLAKKYYLAAMEASKSKKFKALCLRMAGRCEKYKLIYTLDKVGDYYQDFDKVIFKKNSLYNQLKKDFPEYYNDLISNCESFERYYSERKKTAKSY